jgi:hypothetical protein
LLDLGEQRRIRRVRRELLVVRLEKLLPDLLAL